MKALLLFLMIVVALSAQAQKGKDLPAVNSEIVAYVKVHEGQKIGRGECWDLAAEALNSVKADWDGFYGFGKEVQPDDVLPGDIAQFEGVQVEVRTENAIHRESYGHHTAIVMEVHAPRVFTIAHQNAGPGGRTVNETDLALANVKSGTIRFYRPQR